MAAFIKRFSRLGMSAPPAGAMLAIAFIHNLIRRHPSCILLLHKPHKSGPMNGPDGTPGQDVYKENEAMPADSRAVESSLWEIQALREHYCPQVQSAPSCIPPSFPLGAVMDSFNWDFSSSVKENKARIHDKIYCHYHCRYLL